MKDIIAKLIDAGKTEALSSPDELKKAALELGFSEEAIDKALDEFDKMPLDDDALDDVVGGVVSSIRPLPLRMNKAFLEEKSFASDISATWNQRVANMVDIIASAAFGRDPEN